MCLHRGSTRHGTAGMTLVELMVAMTIFGVVVTSAVAFVARQNTAFQDAIVRLGALRNVRYAVTALVQDVETLGTNVPSTQPSLVYADENVIVFSSDYATNVAGDPFAVFYDPDAPTGQVRAPSNPFTIPTTTIDAADSAYVVQGVPSPAEMIVFFLLEDTTTQRADDHVLYRQVNGGEPEALARNLLRVNGAPFFSYERQVEDSTGAISFEVVAASDLPLWHASPFHSAAADTAMAAWPDSIRAVRVTLGGTNGLTGDEESRVETSRLIALPNAGLAILNTCGSPPLLGVAFAATATTLPGGDPAVDLTWTPAVDESGGEGDVVRYVLWRRYWGESDWGDPYVAIPAGAATYTYTDAAVQSGVGYEFALAAQDCTPTLSALTASPPVIVP